jgi:hypothetical protein
MSYSFSVWLGSWGALKWIIHQVFKSRFNLIHTGKMTYSVIKYKSLLSTINVHCIRKKRGLSFMKHVLVLISVLLVATGAYAKGAAKKAADIQATSYSDGILFDVNVKDADLEVNISGPGNLAQTKRYAYAESVFVEAAESNGKSIPDGLYKYEARAIPAVSISREESSAMPGRNELHGKTDAKMNPFSGTFRILNGSMVDSEYDEYGENAQ